MTTTPLPSPDLHLPQELKDAIIFYLASDLHALLACSLAHRTLRPTAQSHLFHAISLSRASHAQAFRRLLHTSPHISSYVRKLYIEASPDRWIDNASCNADLATILSALSPHLNAFSLNVLPTCYSYLGELRYALRRIAPAALSLSGLRLIPPELVAGVRALRLEDASIDTTAASVNSTAGSVDTKTQCVCAPTALELCSITPGALASLRLDVRKLTRLRLDGATEEAGALVALCAATLQILEVDMSVPVPQVTPDPGTLPALRVLAVRDVRHVRCWLLAAPDVRHLIVYVPVGRMGLEVDAGFGDVIVSGHKQENPGMQRAETAALPVPRKNAVLQGHVIAAGRALEDVTIVAYAGEGDERQAEVVGSFRKEGYRRCRDSEGYVVSGPRVAKNMEGEVEIRRVWIPRPNVEAGEARPSLISPDILDVVDWA